MMMGGMMGGMGFGRGGRRFGPAMAINGQSFDMDRIDVETKRGTLELWEIGSQMMAHPFHVHGTQFQILSLNGQVPPLHYAGLEGHGAGGAKGANTRPTHAAGVTRSSVHVPLPYP